jgi:hypothetical protein
MTSLTFLEAVEQFLDKHQIPADQRKEMTSDLTRLASHFAGEADTDFTLTV